MCCCVLLCVLFVVFCNVCWYCLLCIVVVCCVLLLFVVCCCLLCVVVCDEGIQTHVHFIVRLLDHIEGSEQTVS